MWHGAIVDNRECKKGLLEIICDNGRNRQSLLTRLWCTWLWLMHQIECQSSFFLLPLPYHHDGGHDYCDNDVSTIRNEELWAWWCGWEPQCLHAIMSKSLCFGWSSTSLRIIYWIPSCVELSKNNFQPTFSSHKNSTLCRFRVTLWHFEPDFLILREFQARIKDFKWVPLPAFLNYKNSIRSRFKVRCSNLISSKNPACLSNLIRISQSTHTLQSNHKQWSHRPHNLQTPSHTLASKISSTIIIY